MATLSVHHGTQTQLELLLSNLLKTLEQGKVGIRTHFSVSQNQSFGPQEFIVSSWEKNMCITV